MYINPDFPEPKQTDPDDPRPKMHMSITDRDFPDIKSSGIDPDDGPAK